LKLKHDFGLVTISLVGALMPALSGRAASEEVPYYGGFGTGFLRCFENGTYGKGEIRFGNFVVLAILRRQTRL
jgi:hypothetical protein